MISNFPRMSLSAPGDAWGF